VEVVNDQRLRGLIGGPELGGQDGESPERTKTEPVEGKKKKQETNTLKIPNKPGGGGKQKGGGGKGKMGPYGETGGRTITDKVSSPVHEKVITGHY